MVVEELWTVTHCYNLVGRYREKRLQLRKEIAILDTSNKLTGREARDV
jgi:hypothetical protein